jgi:hypothetical protein
MPRHLAPLSSLENEPFAPSLENEPLLPRT